MDDNDALMNEEEAAAYLSTSTRHIKRLIYERRIGFVKIGRYNRFRRLDLDRFIEANRTAAKR